MRIEVTLDDASMDNIDRNCRAVGGDIAEAIAIFVLDEVAGPIEVAARDFCPVGNSKNDIFAGLLKKSIGRRVYRKKRVCGVVIGPLRNKGVDVGREQHMNTGTKKIPTRYAHWQEFGTSHSAPQPFMRPAWDTDGGTVALGRFVDAYSTRLEEAVSKLPQTP